MVVDRRYAVCHTNIFRFGISKPLPYHVVALDQLWSLLAGLLAAINPTSVFFVQEARPYALVGLLDGLALLAIATYGRRSTERGIWLWPWLALFVCSDVDTFMAHYTSLLFIAACFAAIGLDLVTRRPFPARDALRWLCAGLVTTVVIMKPLALAMSLSGSTNIAWIKPLTLGTVRVFFMDLLTHPAIPYNTVTVSIGIILLLILTFSLLLGRLDRTQFSVLVATPSVFIILLIGASASRPMLLVRVGVWLTIPLCVLLARAVTRQATTWRRATIGVLLTAIFLFGLGHYRWVYRAEDWRAVARVVATEPRCSGPILFGYGSGLGQVYYEPALINRPYMLSFSATRIERPPSFC